MGEAVTTNGARYAAARRRKSYRREALLLDPGCTVSGGRQYLGGRAYDLYVVKDSAGVQIGWTEGNEQGEAMAWLRALGELQRRARAAAVDDAARVAVEGEPS